MTRDFLNAPALVGAHVLNRIQEARERVAHGFPSITLALAGHPISTAQARLAEAEEAKRATRPSPWALVLTEALALVEEARETWGSAPDAMPPAMADLAPCGWALRMHLPEARKCAEMRVAWEDPGGLTRGQALCVVHLAACVAEWRMVEQRAEAREAQARAEMERERRASSAVAARAIWGGAPARPPMPALASDSRSLRELAREMGVLRQSDENDEA